MSNIQPYHPSENTELALAYNVLQEHGGTDINPATIVIPDLSETLQWESQRFYGYEVRLRQGGIGRVAVQQVALKPDAYTASRPDQLEKFYERQYTGLLLSASWASASRHGASWGRRLALQANTPAKTFMTYSGHKTRQIGRVGMPVELTELLAPISIRGAGRLLTATEAADVSPSLPQIIGRSLSNLYD